MYCFLFYSALYWCCFLSPFSNVKKEKDLSVILMLCMKCRQCMLLACSVKIPWITPWLCSLAARGPRWLSWECRQEWKVLFSWAKETMLAHARPLQRSYTVVWHWTLEGLLEEPLCKLNLAWELFRLTWAVLLLAAVRALRARGTSWH